MCFAKTAVQSTMYAQYLSSSGTFMVAMSTMFSSRRRLISSSMSKTPLRPRRPRTLLRSTASSISGWEWRPGRRCLQRLSPSHCHRRPCSGWAAASGLWRAFPVYWCSSFWVGHVCFEKVSVEPVDWAIEEDWRTLRILEIYLPGEEVAQGVVSWFWVLKLLIKLAGEEDNDASNVSNKKSFIPNVLLRRNWHVQLYSCLTGVGLSWGKSELEIWKIFSFIHFKINHSHF